MQRQELEIAAMNDDPTGARTSNERPCEHPTLRTGDTFDTLNKLSSCLFCERDRLRRENEEHLKTIKGLCDRLERINTLAWATPLTGKTRAIQEIEDLSGGFATPPNGYREESASAPAGPREKADHPQAPIARIQVGDDGKVVAGALYAPGLPPGKHDLYCEPDSTPETSEHRDYASARDALDRTVVELERYKKALYAANGFLMQLGREPVKLEYPNRDVSAERCRNAATVSETSESYSCSDLSVDARTPAGAGIASPALSASPLQGLTYWSLTLPSLTLTMTFGCREDLVYAGERLKDYLKVDSFALKAGDES